jgi:alkylation response protein AidB-like acyl-CoA dehydrogenase
MPIASAGRIVDAGLVLLSADAFGGASESVARAVEYAKEREQFGRKIGSFQALKHQLADMALAVEPTIGLYWYAAHVFDTQPKDAPLAAALAKAHITELYPKIARKMIEAHGGIGYTWEYGAHVWLKRALFDQAYFGMPYTHRARAAQLSGW